MLVLIKFFRRLFRRAAGLARSSRQCAGGGLRVQSVRDCWNFPLTFPSPRAYNSAIPGMTENTFPFPGLSESARTVRARKDAKEIPPPDRGGQRPISRPHQAACLKGARHFTGAKKQTTRVEPRAMKASSRSSLHFHMTGRAFLYAPPKEVWS